MVKLGNKLQLNADKILRTTRRGLLLDLYIYLLDKNIATMTEVKQNLQLREMISGVNNQVSHHRVHFAANTQNNTAILQASIEKLTNVKDKLHISMLSTTLLNTRPRPSLHSPTIMMRTMIVLMHILTSNQWRSLIAVKFYVVDILLTSAESRSN